MNHRLKIQTLPGYRDMLRTSVSSSGSKLALFNPQDEGYELIGNDLYYNGVLISMEDILEQVVDVSINKPLLEPLLPYAIYSFIRSDRFDLRNNVQFETTVTEFSKYFGLSTGSKGFRLLGKLDVFRTIYGVIPEFGVFPFLEIHYQAGKLVLISHYLHHAFNMMLSDCFDRFGERGIYETEKVHASIVMERNKTAALIVIELVRLVVTAGRKGKPHISLQELVACIPSLYSIWKSNNSTSFKNRQLLRAFDGIVELLEQKTELFNDFEGLNVNIPSLKVSSLNEVIHISHNNNIGRGEKSNAK